MGLRTLLGLKKNKGIEYVPKIHENPKNVIHSTSAWVGLEKIIKDIIIRFDLNSEKCLEFGVEFGYSTVVLSNYFDKVVGVDLFTGDEHAGFYADHYESTKERLSSFKNIELIQANYKDYIKDNRQNFDLIHVDIIHDYEHTFECGLWSARHSKCTIFHDTESFPEVKKAVYDISRKVGKKFYNYPHCNGLGIIA
jgi:hypothetical protein